MKKSIKLILLLVVASTWLFATPVTNSTGRQPGDAKITFSTLPGKNGIEIKVKKAEAGKAIIIIYNNDGTILRKDVWSHSTVLEKGYVLSQLEVGDYSVEVTVNKQIVKQAIHVYMEGSNKTFILKS